MSLRRCWVLLLFSFVAVAQAPEPNRDPMKARLVTTDIVNFWNAYDKATLANAGDVFQRDYIDAGSPGMRGFLQGRIGNGRVLAGTVASRPKYYAAIRENTLSLDRKPEIKAAIHASFRKMKEIYPDAIFPDVYFLIGRMNSAGTTGAGGLLIGVEMNARDDKTPVDELDPWSRAVTGTIDVMPNIVAHELIHIEQQHANPLHGLSGKQTLLSAALGEGAGDFLGEIISGGIINRVQRKFGDDHEQELWTEFSAAMHGTETNRWLYEGDKAQGRPADMGYYEGYKICQAYYNKATDKQAAVRTILEMKDPEGFLKESGYDPR